MKVLYVDTFGSAYANDNTSGLKAAYERVAEVDLFDYRTINARHGAVAMNLALLEKATSFKPDLVHLGKGEDIEGQTIRQIRSLGSTVIHFFGDMRLSVVSTVLNIGREANGTLLSTTDPRIVQPYREQGVNVLGWWDAGTDPKVFYPREAEKTYDVTFFGSNNLAGLPHEGNRQRLLLMQGLEQWGFDLHLFGTGWDGFRNAHPPVYGDEFARVASASKVTLGINNVNDYVHYASWRRTFNCMSCGSLHLTHYIPGMDRMFNIDYDIVCYHSIWEAASLVDYYLRHPDERGMMAVRGRNAVLKRHTWDHRVSELLTYYERCKSGTTSGTTS